MAAKRLRAILILERPGEKKLSAQADIEIIEGKCDLTKVPAIVDSIERLMVAAADANGMTALTMSLRPLRDDEV